MSGSDGHVVIACDKFKGSLDAQAVVHSISAGINSVKNVAVRSVLVADGGDGTISSVVSAGFTPVPAVVSGPIGELVDTHYAVQGDVAVVEMADACGLIRLARGKREPLRSSSLGLGQIMQAALETKPKRLIIGVGGSASSDGGLGMLLGLGAVARDEAGDELRASGASLAKVASLDLSGLPQALQECEVILASDVDNPLLGSKGAVSVFGPQKGAIGVVAEQLEKGLRNWVKIVKDTVGNDSSEFPGAGSAGGVGFAAMSILGASMRSGVELILELNGFSELLLGAQLVITGEGSLDEQTLMGKVVAGVAKAARSVDVPVVAVCGRCLLDKKQLTEMGIQRAYPLADIEPDRARSMTLADELLQQVSANLAQDYMK